MVQSICRILTSSTPVIHNSKRFFSNIKANNDSDKVQKWCGLYALYSELFCMKDTTNPLFIHIVIQSLIQRISWDKRSYPQNSQS